MSDIDPTYVEALESRIADLERLITPVVRDRPGIEYSFPTKDTGISLEELRLMSLGQANGVIHGDNGAVNTSPNSTGWRYYLTGWASDAETNSKNSMWLRAGKSAEALIEGVYHRLTEDMEISLPPVSTRTTYYICITYDPREFDSDQGPASIKVYTSQPPSSSGRVHILLYEVERAPNQLLTQAKITRFRPYTAGVVSVQNKDQLPDASQYPAGTLAVPSAEGQGVFVRQNGGLVWLDAVAHKADKPSRWWTMDILAPSLSGVAAYRRVAEGVQVYINMRSESHLKSAYIAYFPSSSGITFKRPWFDTMVTTPATENNGTIYYLDEDTYNSRAVRAYNSSTYHRYSGIIPDYVLNLPEQ